MQPVLIYYQVTVPRRPGPANLYVVEPSAGPVRAIRLHHPTKTWTYDPATVQARLMDDFDQGDNRISRVDRTRAEEIAQLLETQLPSEAEIRKLMQTETEATTD